MGEEKTGGYISKIHFNNGEEVDIAPSDIVIFVGPNNAGKSQSLKDIYALSRIKSPTVVISDISICKYAGKLTNLLNSISIGQNQGNYTNYEILGGRVAVHGSTESTFQKSSYYDDYRVLFIANLDTSARLSICQPQPNITRNAPKQHPIHYAAFDPEYRKWLSKSFKKAFGADLIPNINFGSVIPLCIGEPVKLSGDFEDEQDRQEAYADVLANYKQVQNQGDGVKSFTGILLYLMLDYYCTFLIDEPESFLHPPQARIMGQIIGETLSDQQQAFIATHSEDIIKGLLEICPNRLKIVRITREGDINRFSVLDNDSFTQVWNDPLLKNSNIMSSLFHKTVILCESDADCQMYSIIENHLKQKQGKYSETLFIHCGGKQRMARVIRALRALDVDLRVVPDLDVLNDESVFRGIVEAYGIEWNSIEKDYKTIVSNIRSGSKETINRVSVKTALQCILNKSDEAILSQDEIKQIQDTVKISSCWDSIKKNGISAIPSGDAMSAYRRLDSVLKSAGIHIVPVGELECFIKEVGGHGPTWVNTVLEQFPDFDNEVYSKISDYVNRLNL